MTSKQQELAPAITLLERSYVEAQKVANDKLAALNAVRAEAGLPARQLGIETGTEGAPVLTQIKRDTFYGKKQMTAMREYLEMRRVQGDGPATPREIFDALSAGGYNFEASEESALIYIRAMLRKANTVFHKLPGTGSYGLLAWYPDARPSKDDDDESPSGSSGTKRRKGRPRKTSRGSAEVSREPKRRGRPPKAKQAANDAEEADTATAAE